MLATVNKPSGGMLDRLLINFNVELKLQYVAFGICGYTSKICFLAVMAVLCIDGKGLSHERYHWQ